MERVLGATPSSVLSVNRGKAPKIHWNWTWDESEVVNQLWIWVRCYLFCFVDPSDQTRMASGLKLDLRTDDMGLENSEIEEYCTTQSELQ